MAVALKKIETLSSGNVLIGALVRNTDLAYDKTIVKRFPVLSQAILAGASPQLRNMATTAGNVLQFAGVTPALSHTGSANLTLSCPVDFAARTPAVASHHSNTT